MILPSASTIVEHLLFEDVTNSHSFWKLELQNYIFQKGATLFNRST